MRFVPTRHFRDPRATMPRCERDPCLCRISLNNGSTMRIAQRQIGRAQDVIASFDHNPDRCRHARLEQKIRIGCTDDDVGGRGVLMCLRRWSDLRPRFGLFPRPTGVNGQALQHSLVTWNPPNALKWHVRWRTGDRHSLVGPVIDSAAIL
jgi:hypothetical protein